MGFQQNAEFAGPYAQTSQVDVDLGNSPATFVTAAYWQIYGSAPSPATVTQQVNNLLTLPYWRRIDVVNTFMAASGRTIPRVYSEPWQSEPQLLNPPCKNLSRDVGAVCMFFFSCPGGTNCGLDWANTHVEGMSSATTLLAYGSNSTGYYTSSSDAGFWERELLDARYAGLSYLLPNAYGPDITDGSIGNLASALATVNSMGVTGQVKIGLFDDTSGWNNNGDFPYAPWNNSLWTTASTLDGYNTTQINSAASIIYQNKWKAFFSQIPSQYWYEVNGHPLVYMYYGGTIPVDGSSQPVIAQIVAQIKTLFQADFGVTPYVVIDIGFSYGEANVADNQFVWNTLASPYVTNYLSTYTNNGVTADLAMVKWDPLGRDDGGSNAVATNYSGGYSSAGGVIKDDSYLKAALNNSTNATFLTLATWNDLGEGTGINRQYDYYVNGQWQPPDYFMNDIRHSQAQVTCVATSTATLTSTVGSTSTQTMTNTATATLSSTRTATAANTATFTPTVSATFTPSVTSSPTLTASNTHTPTSGLTSTPTPSVTSTQTAAQTPTSSATSTPTVWLTSTSTHSMTPTVSSTLHVPSTATATPSFTMTQTPMDSSTPTPTFTRTVTLTETGTASFTASVTPTPTPSNSPTASMTWTVTSTVTSRNTVTETQTVTTTRTSTGTPTPVLERPVAYPNPITGPGPVQLKVPDMGSTRVKVDLFTLSFRKIGSQAFEVTSGADVVAVALADAYGKGLANGLYYFRVEESNQTWTVKVLVLR